MNREAFFEIGVVLFVLSVTAGVVMLFGGRIFGGAKRAGGKNQSAPTAGDVPSNRHQHIASSSPR